MYFKMAEFAVIKSILERLYPDAEITVYPFEIFVQFSFIRFSSEDISAIVNLATFTRSVEILDKINTECRILSEFMIKQGFKVDEFDYTHSGLDMHVELNAQGCEINGIPHSFTSALDFIKQSLKSDELNKLYVEE